jgi:2'-5' RNA ligase
MPYAVTLRLDAEAAAHLRRLQAVIEAEDLIEYAPHVTLAVYPDDRNVENMRRALHTLAAQWPALAVQFAAVGLFPGVKTVLWAAPVVTEELLHRHAELLQVLPAGHSHYRRGSWVPHVTLAQELTGAGAAAAIAALDTIWQPFGGTLDRVDIVHFAPVEIIGSWRLAQSQAGCG